MTIIYMVTVSNLLLPQANQKIKYEFEKICWKTKLSEINTNKYLSIHTLPNADQVEKIYDQLKDNDNNGDHNIVMLFADTSLYKHGMLGFEFSRKESLLVKKTYMIMPLIKEEKNIISKVLLFIQNDYLLRYGKPTNEDRKSLMGIEAKNISWENLNSKIKMVTINLGVTIGFIEYSALE